MDFQFGVELDLGDAAKVFSQDRGFDLELMFVAGVLIVTSAAALKVRTARLDAPG